MAEEIADKKEFEDYNYNGLVFLAEENKKIKEALDDLPNSLVNPYTN